MVPYQYHPMAAPAGRPFSLLRLTARAFCQIWWGMRRRTKTVPSPLARITALVAIGLVLVLTVLAASPDLHERLHARDHAASSQATPAGNTAPDDDSGCVVTLFAQGLLLALCLFALAHTGQRLRLADLAVVDRVPPESPAYRFLPTQAPPLSPA
jgi:hypothetical protein